MDPQTLISFFSSRQPRRIKVIENLLQGRETVSTLYWGMRYHLLNYLGTLKSIDFRVTKRSLIRLVNQDRLIKVGKRSYIINSRRVELTKSNSLAKSLRINLYYNLKRFKARFLLATQVVSEYSYRNSNYYPIQINIHDAKIVKYWFHYNKRSHLVTRFYQVLKTYFSKLSKDDETLAWQAASLLIGYRVPGRTLMQLKQELGFPIVKLELRQLEILCGLIDYLLQDRDRLLVPLLAGLKVNPVNNSALLTFKMYLHQVSLLAIARRRHLKISTVKEHLLTVAIFSDQRFPYHLFFSSHLLNDLKRVYYGNVDRWSYDRFQRLTGRSIDFFYFRLYQIMRSKIND